MHKLSQGFDERISLARPGIAPGHLRWGRGDFQEVLRVPKKDGFHWVSGAFQRGVSREFNSLLRVFHKVSMAFQWAKGKFKGWGFQKPSKVIERGIKGFQELF